MIKYTSNGGKETVEVEMECDPDEEMLITAGADLQRATLSIMAEMYRTIIKGIDNEEEREKLGADLLEAVHELDIYDLEVELGVIH